MRGQHQRRLFVERRLPQSVAVDPDRAAVQNPLDPAVARGVENDLRAVHVGPVCLKRIGHDLTDVGHRSEVDDHIALVHSPTRSVAVGDVSQDRPDLGRGVMTRLREIEDHRLMAFAPQPIDDMRPDEAAAARDEDSHVATTSPSGSATGW